jgi:hypothetical protein
MSEVERDQTWLLSDDHTSYSFEMDAEDGALPDLDNTTLTPITGVLFLDCDDAPDAEIEEIQGRSFESFGVYSDISGNDDDVSWSFRNQGRNGVALCDMCGAVLASTTASDGATSTCHLCCGDAPLLDYQSLYLLADVISAVDGGDTKGDDAGCNGEGPTYSDAKQESTSDGSTSCNENCGLLKKYFDHLLCAIKPTIERKQDLITKKFRNYQTDLKSKVSLVSFFEEDSMSYSSLEDCSSALSDKQQEMEPTRYPNQLGRIVSCALPNGLYFCTIWLNQPADENDRFVIQGSHHVVWKPRQRSRAPPHATDLLECFSWASNTDHTVVQHVNSVVQQLLLQDQGTNQDEVVLWTTPQTVLEHFVDVHGNAADTVYFITDPDGSQRILFFVKTVESDLLLLSPPSDETSMEEEEEAVLGSNDETSNITTAVDNRKGSPQGILDDEKRFLELD